MRPSVATVIRPFVIQAGAGGVAFLSQPPTGGPPMGYFNEASLQERAAIAITAALTLLPLVVYVG